MANNTEHKEMLWGRLVFQCVGDIELVTFFGFHIYERVGNISSLFGLTYGK